MNSRLLEIQKEINAHLMAILDLRSEEWFIISTRFRFPGPAITFDGDGRTIRWDDGEIKVGPKSWLFLKTLWRGGKKHRAKLDRIERNVWGEGRFVPSNTIAQMAKRLSETLKNTNFPYKILPAKKKETLEIQGYQLSYDIFLAKNVIASERRKIENML